MKIKKIKLVTLLGDFVALFYPRLCLACDRNLSVKDDVICLFCQYQLPRTDYHQQPDNPLTQRFWGRLRLEGGTALFHFVKGGKVQRLMHRLKYQGNKEIGYHLGLLHGRQLQDSKPFYQADLIVPVPLHPRKKHRRGYNQSAWYARGLSEQMNIPWMGNAMTRHSFTTTQTLKSRHDRFENVLKAFHVHHPDRIRNKNILLVDDILTTGATLEACALKLLEVPGVKVSIAVMAIAEY